MDTRGLSHPAAAAEQVCAFLSPASPARAQPAPCPIPVLLLPQAGRSPSQTQVPLLHQQHPVPPVPDQGWNENNAATATPGRHQPVPGCGKGAFTAPPGQAAGQQVTATRPSPAPCHHVLISGVSFGGKALQETFASGTLLLRWHGVGHLRHQPSHGCREDFLFQHTDKLEDSNPQHMRS